RLMYFLKISLAPFAHSAADRNQRSSAAFQKLDHNAEDPKSGDQESKCAGNWGRKADTMAKSVSGYGFQKLRSPPLWTTVLTLTAGVVTLPLPLPPSQRLLACGSPRILLLMPPLSKPGGGSRK